MTITRVDVLAPDPLDDSSAIAERHCELACHDSRTAVDAPQLVLLHEKPE